MSDSPSDESKKLAIEIAHLFKDHPHRVALTALVLVFATTIGVIGMDTEGAITLFGEQVRKTLLELERLKQAKKEKETVQ